MNRKSPDKGQNAASTSSSGGVTGGPAPHPSSPLDSIGLGLWGLLSAGRAVSPVTSAIWALRPLRGLPLAGIAAVAAALLGAPPLLTAAVGALTVWLAVDGWARWRVRATHQHLRHWLHGEPHKIDWEPVTGNRSGLRARLTLNLVQVGYVVWVAVGLAGVGVAVDEPAFVAFAVLLGVISGACAGLAWYQYASLSRRLPSRAEKRNATAFPATDFTAMPSDGPPTDEEAVLAWFAPVVRTTSTGRFGSGIIRGWTGPDSIERIRDAENTLLVTDRAVYLACALPDGFEGSRAADLGVQAFLIPWPLRNSVDRAMGSGGLRRVWAEAGGCFSIALRRITHVAGWETSVVFHCGATGVIGYSLRTAAEAQHLTETVIRLLPVAHQRP